MLTSPFVQAIFDLWLASQMIVLDRTKIANESCTEGLCDANIHFSSPFIVSDSGSAQLIGCYRIRKLLKNLNFKILHNSKAKEMNGSVL